MTYYIPVARLMFELFPSREVAVVLLGFSIHWYGLMYLLAFVLAYALLPRLQRYRGLELTNDDISSILTWVILGVIVGGRLGYVIFYAPSYFFLHPADIVAVWKGGMSSHGGFIGVAITLSYALRKRQIPFWPFLDVMVIPVAVGLALGRLGNFINFELYGTVTDLPWAMSIPGVEGLRHPTQIYAIIKNLLIAAVLFWHLRPPRLVGTTFALFLMLYSILRFIVEYYRVQDVAGLSVLGTELTRGQALTIPLMLIGLMLYWSLSRRTSVTDLD